MMLLLHLGCGDDRRVGFDNLDARTGWRFEDGLPDYRSGSVSGITISHALMYVDQSEWLDIFREFHRVLVPFGCVRITEDDCESPESPRTEKPWPGFVTRTGPIMTGKLLTDAGFAAHVCRADETYFIDDSLLIAHREHKCPRYVYYIEGIRK